MFKFKSIGTHIVFLPFEFIFSWIAGMRFSDAFSLNASFDHIFLVLVFIGLFYIRFKLSLNIKWKVYFPLLLLFAIITFAQAKKYFNHTADQIHQQSKSQ